jgi:hypothetical protein
MADVRFGLGIATIASAIVIAMIYLMGRKREVKSP